MTTKDGLDFEAIAREIFHNLFCDHVVLRTYSDSKKYHAGIDKLSQALKDAFDAGYTRSGIKDEQSAETIPDREQFAPNQFLFDTIESSANRIKSQVFSDLNEKNFISFKCDQILTALSQIKRLNPHLFGEGK